MEKSRIDITIRNDILQRFRKKFVAKKGDLSNIIQELMIKKLGEKN
jgi:hypothetical protein